MKKNLVLAILLIGFTISLTAETQERIFIVRPRIISSTKEHFLEESKLWANVRRDVSEWYRDVIEGWHGSGFLYVGENGENFIITNRHVLSHAASADITEISGEVELTYTECPVVYVSDGADFAVLAFPENIRPFTEGFQIYDGIISAGTAVSAAGYPGNGDGQEPIWSLTEGIVIDGTAYLRYPDTNDFAYFIAHSAALRGGNSGGPLLAEIDGKTTVIGINTFVTNGENNIGYALPSSILVKEWDKFMEVQTRNTDLRNQKTLENTCGFFTSHINSGVPDRKWINGVLSEYLVSDFGLEAVESLAGENYTVEEINIKDYFFRRPWETMRLAALEHVLSMLRQDLPFRYEGMVEENLDTDASFPPDGVQSRFRDEKSEYIITWALLYGEWRITGIDREPIRKRHRYRSSG